MSRLGDLIRLERTRQKLTYKQVARKCGVSEKYLEEVESGRRIIQDDQARRILRAMGMQQQTEADFTLDDIAATVFRPCRFRKWKQRMKTVPLFRYRSASPFLSKDPFPLRM